MRLWPSSVLVWQVFPPDEMEQVSNKDDMKTSLRKVVKEVGTTAGEGEGVWQFLVIETGRSLKSEGVGSLCVGRRERGEVWRKPGPDPAALLGGVGWDA